MKHLLTAAILLGQIQFAQLAVADAYFYGIDLGAGPSGSHSNSDAARNRFLAHLAPASIGVEDFEAVALGEFPGGSRAVTFLSTSVTGTITDLTQSSTVVNDPEIRNFPEPPHWFPTSGTTYFFTEALEGHNYFDLALSEPQTAFGFYGASLSDYDDVPGGPFTPLRISLDGGPAIDVVNVDPATITSGSVNFFGIISDTPFTTVRLHNPLQADTFPFPLTDGIGIDDLTIGEVGDPIDYVLEVEYQNPESTGPLIAGFDPLPPTITARFTLNNIAAGQTTVGLDQVLSFDVEIPGNNPTRSADLDSFQLSLNSNGSPQGLTWNVNTFDIDPGIIITNNNFQLEITGTNPATEDAFRYFWSTSTNTFTPAPGLTGDYNDDGAVDVADYVVWRKHEGTSALLPNDPLGGLIGQSQYDNWRGSFGDSIAGTGGSASVPEPASALILVPLVGLVPFIRVSESHRYVAERITRVRNR